MQVEVNPNGTINRYGRPYIDGEELNVWTLYDPNGPGINYGLYSRVQKPCDAWLNHYWKHTQSGVGANTRRDYDVNRYGVSPSTTQRRIIRPIPRQYTSI